MFAMISAAFVIGLVVAMPPGPVSISGSQRAMTRGFWNAFNFYIGSIVSDTFYALLVYFGLSALLVAFTALVGMRDVGLQLKSVLDAAKSPLRNLGKLSGFAGRKIEAFFKDHCLLDQPFVKDDAKTIRQLLDEASAALGEKVAVRRFVRYKLGEGGEA